MIATAGIAAGLFACKRSTSVDDDKPRRSATESECALAFDNKVRIDAREARGDGVLGRLSEAAKQGYQRVSGDRGEMIRNCVAHWSSQQAACVMSAESSDVIGKCAQ